MKFLPLISSSKGTLRILLSSTIATGCILTTNAATTTTPVTNMVQTKFAEPNYSYSSSASSYSTKLFKNAFSWEGSMIPIARCDGVASIGDKGDVSTNASNSKANDTILLNNKITLPEGFSKASLSKYFDHTILKPDASVSEILQVCKEARAYNFASVCVNSSNVPIVAENLEGSDVKVCAVVGFPLGNMASSIKAEEAFYCGMNGANEIDMVINVGLLKSRKYDEVRKDIEVVVVVCKKLNMICKVIIETCLLTDEEKLAAAEIALKAGADFVKTSTGFSTSGANIDDVKRLSAAAHLFIDERELTKISATCDLLPRGKPCHDGSDDSNNATKGVVTFTQSDVDAACVIDYKVTGLKPGLHGFHVHEKADFSNGCVSAGPHYNPHNKKHGGPGDEERHAGDLGNIEANGEGVAEGRIIDTLVRLSGEFSVIGRSVMVHADPDDCGKGGHKDSLTTGNAGARIACGEIKVMDNRNDTSNSNSNSKRYFKASGGIRDGNAALHMIAAGADRLGTSATVKVFDECNSILNSSVISYNIGSSTIAVATATTSQTDLAMKPSSGSSAY